MADEGHKPKKRSTTLVLDEPGLPMQHPAANKDCYLVLIHPPGMEIGARFELEEDYYLVGRESDAGIRLQRESVSRRHAELKRSRTGQWTVRDLGSTNGTYINEEEITELTIKNGDQVCFGDIVFKFLSSDNVESMYHAEVYQLSVLDGLTGVHNKRYFDDFLERELASAQRHQNPLTLVLIDIDHFKSVNDERGHLCGDAVLKQLADRIKPRIRREDLFARYGGEEFAFILTITPLEGGLRFAETIRDMVERQPFIFEGDRVAVTISLGVATTLNETKVDPDDLIARADQALYAAKNSGRNRVCAAPPEE